MTLEAELIDYICQCPLLGLASICEEDVRSNAEEWLRLGQLLCQILSFDFSNLDSVQRLRVFHYYLPVYMWMVGQLRQHREGGSEKPLVMGISAPQGCGKTTLVTCLEELMAAEGLKAASISIDDFYLTNADQTALGKSHSSNPLVQYRGNAATHDMELGARTLADLTSATGPVPVPRYDKSKFAGRGDRAAVEEWPVVEGPLDIVLFEGWMLGFRPQPASVIQSVDENLLLVNEALKAYKDAWDQWADCWLVIRVEDPQYVYKWRLQAEEQMRAGGKPGMTDEQIADFVSRFMPAYQAYLPDLYDKGPTTCAHGRTLVIQVDETRSPVAEQPAPVV
mmetsp:Transcript_11024/g.31152  ORF Transcript_11024/g.31152 Transcript_11024/m.31152 type:complete len:337 (+) Transcript_11024:458-1468(+)